MEVIALLGIVAIVVAFVYAFVRKAPLSLTISVAILVVYALLAATSRYWGEPSRSLGYWDLVLMHPGRWNEGELYTFFTSMFVHQNLMHIGFNTGALIFIGVALEEKIGTPAFAVIFIIGGLMGTLTYYLIHYHELFILLGASGAISAELGAYARLYPREKLTLFLPVPLPPIPAIWVAIGFLIVSSMLVFIIPNIAHEAHIGGLLTGLLIGPLAARLPSKMEEAASKLDVRALAPLAKTLELKDVLTKIEVETVPPCRQRDKLVEKRIARSSCSREAID